MRRHHQATNALSLIQTLELLRARDVQRLIGDATGDPGHANLLFLVTPEEIQRLLSVFVDDPPAVRDRAILLLFLDAGLRLGEMALLRREQVHFGENGGAWIQVYSPKSRSFRFVVLGKTATAALREYFRSRADDNPALWINRNGKALTQRGIYWVVKRRARQAGLENRVHPHLT